MIAVLVTACLSALLCLVYARVALRLQWLDTPNERSSHVQPTPHGGGTALVLAFLCGMALAGSGTVGQGWEGWSPAYVMMALITLLLCAMGVVDDLATLSVKLRFAVYAAACLAFVITLSTVLAVRDPWPLWSALPVAFAMLWLLNLYNFMDGIDGIAALQTVTVCAIAGALAFFSGASEEYVMLCALLAAAHAGFLVLNWEPAKLFMGDAGSVATGFLLGALAIVGAVEKELNPYCWVILLAVFIVDATWTLLWRMQTGQPFTQPHRLHAYQRLGRHFGSHAKVDFLLLAINILWLAPLAWTASLWPQHSLILVILAYVPLLAGMAKIRRLT